MVFHYFGNERVEQVSKDNDEAQLWVELHIDLLQPEMRETHTVTVNGLKMGGCLSVCFPEGMSPIVKNGRDEVIFKMHSDNKLY